MLRLFIIVFSLLAAKTLGDTCTLDFDSEHPSIYIQKFGSKNTFVLPENGLIKFSDKTNLNIYCPGGVQLYNPSTIMNNVELECRDNQVLIDVDGYLYNFDRNKRKCPVTSQYFEGEVIGCLDQGLIFGFFVNTTPIVIADICYGSDIQRTWFIHYVTGLRSPIVEHQEPFNFANLSYPAVDVVIPNRLAEETLNLDAAVAKVLPNVAGNKIYQMDDLIPLSSASFLEGFTQDLDSTNRIAWWIPLKHGNWKFLEEAMNTYSTNYSLDIYAGFSGYVSYPVNDKCESIDILSYGSKSFPKRVPLYVWNYIKRLDIADDKGVVVVGVNSPFFDSSGSNKLLCEDVCDTVSWFGYLSKTRKMSALGYIFCCDPSDVEDKLEGFPKI